MILYVQGDLFQSPAQVLVNTVNTEGVMGKGVALQFKQMFPEMFAQYRDLCERKQFDIGNLWLYRSPNKWVLNFPTKRHWKQPSRIEYVSAGLKKFVDSYDEMGIHSIAFPPLGCGNGQLDFKSQVQPVMHEYLARLPIDVFIYPDRSDPFVPEHLDPAAMQKWLRSEPSSLPFAEVWGDVRNLLKQQSTFQTVVNQSKFRAYISDDPPGIAIESGAHTDHIPYDSVMAFWQQLRTYGFSMRHIAPGIDRKLSYLTAIFSALEYVKPVRVADQFDKFGKSPVTGLQILPSAFTRSQSSAQMSLFTVE
ncbi:MAG: macro domain-containing protein [Chloroflexi bacterium]|nr:macro domain-containing protein [Chloroflexota bacterium]